MHFGNNNWGIIVNDYQNDMITSIDIASWEMTPLIIPRVPSVNLTTSEAGQVKANLWKITCFYLMSPIAPTVGNAYQGPSNMKKRKKQTIDDLVFINISSDGRIHLSLLHPLHIDQQIKASNVCRHQRGGASTVRPGQSMRCWRSHLIHWTKSPSAISPLSTLEV